MLLDWRLIAKASAMEAKRFETALRSPRETQLKLFEAIIRANAETDFGCRNDFANLRTLEHFRSRIPVASYEKFAADIDCAARTGISPLSSATPVAFERTGGSSSGGKLVPYNQAALDAFRCAVLPWMHGLLQRHEAIGGGRFYATISPATRKAELAPSGLPIGLSSDAAYLGEGLAMPFVRLLAVPPELSALSDVEQWRIATLAALIEADDLTFISLWSPTFLLALMDSLPRLSDTITELLTPAARRRFDQAMRGALIDTAVLWPILSCISCWTDGPSAGFATALADRFPHVSIDPKGVLATESPVTLSWGHDGRCVPALTSCLIEFIDREGNSLLCDELQEGDSYRAVITTPGGFYRYDIGDLFECRAMAAGVPDLRFVGRAGVSCDLVGEKLEDGFVSGILCQLSLPCVIAPRNDGTGYELLVESNLREVDIITKVERALCENPQYEYARRLGQLEPLSVRFVDDLSSILIGKGLVAGRLMGDVKSHGLLQNPFDGQIIP